MQNNEKGQTTTEYGLILMIVSVAIIGVMVITAGSLHDLYQGAGDVVHAAVEKVMA